MYSLIRLTRWLILALRGKFIGGLLLNKGQMVTVAIAFWLKLGRLEKVVI